jgi:hypothetical protein
MSTIQLNGERNKFFVNTGSLQMKMFIHHDLKEAEKAIGQWLQHQDVIIHHISQSQSEKGGQFLFVMSVFYEKM